MNNYNKYSQKAAKRYNLHAKKYEKIYFKDHSDKKYLIQFAKRLKKGVRVLEVGCGPGRDLQVLSKMGFDLTGIDISKEMLKIARKHNLEVELREMDISNMIFKDASFDGVYTLYALIHLPKNEIRKALKKIYQMLKPRGIFLLVDHDDEFEGDLPDLMDERKRPLFRCIIPKDKMVDILMDIGFEIISIEQRDFPETGVKESTKGQYAILARKGA